MKSHRDEPFFMMLQHYDVHGPLTAPKEMVKKYTDCGHPLAKGNENATFLAMKESFDQSFGRITATLEELELDDNTIVIFFSDNGGVSYVANNGQLRRGKKWLYEGGIRVPMAIRVPGVTQPGSRCDTAVNGIDFFPTLVELTGGQPEQLESVLDGVSLVPLLKGSETLKRDALYWHLPQLGKGDGTIIPPQGMVRMGPWKLIHYYGNTAEPELYNVETDIEEKVNVASDYPERVEQMQLMLEKHLNEVDAQRVEVVK